MTLFSMALMLMIAFSSQCFAAKYEHVVLGATVKGAKNYQMQVRLQKTEFKIRGCQMEPTFSGYCSRTDGVIKKAVKQGKGFEYVSPDPDLSQVVEFSDFTRAHEAIGVKSRRVPAQSH